MAAASLSMPPLECLIPMSQRVEALYAENLAKHQDISIDQLQKMFTKESTTISTESKINLPEVKYFQDFMSDPAVQNAEIGAKREKMKSSMAEEEFYRIFHSSKHHELRRHRRFDFRLNEREIDKLEKRGLVVSERFQVESFAEGYYRTYTDDLPVYITADSILHAWHRSYDTILQEIETEILKPQLQKIVAALIDMVNGLREQNKGPSLEYGQCLDEIEFFIGVGAELLVQEREETMFESKQRKLDPFEDWMEKCHQSSSMQDMNAEVQKFQQPVMSPTVTDKVKTALDWIKNEKISEVTLFGKSRDVDFSLFHPRGHYTTSASLMNYFQAMMWFGTIDFQIAGNESSNFELLCALVFSQIVSQGNAYETWREFDSLLTLLVGEPDSMTVRHFIQLIGDADLSAYCSALARNEFVIEALKTQIINSEVGKQAICGHPLVANLETSKPTELPRSFTFLGQRFLIDSYVLSKVVFDNVTLAGKKLSRRIPSGLDVAFTLFQNDATLPELSKRMKDQTSTSSSYVQYRDGLEYSANLAALRLAFEQLEPDYMYSSILNRWLDALRELSESASHRSRTCHSSDWQMKQLATQLASWTQLRHDNMLYIKQSFTCSTRCEYPAGFVDPYPKFWCKMRELAEATAFQLDIARIVRSSKRIEKYKSFFGCFANIMSSLESISKKQALREPLTDEETRVLKTVMEERHGSGGTRYLGWYPKLFYLQREDSGKADYLVADVHTDAPDFALSGDPGSILHAGVGKVLTAFVIVEHEKGQWSMYAGPVYSYYEFTTPINQRLTDEKWTEMVKEKKTPPMPLWATESFVSIDGDWPTSTEVPNREIKRKSTEPAANTDQSSFRSRLFKQI